MDEEAAAAGAAAEVLVVVVVAACEAAAGSRLRGACRAVPVWALGRAAAVRGQVQASAHGQGAGKSRARDRAADRVREPGQAADCRAQEHAPALLEEELRKAPVPGKAPALGSVLAEDRVVTSQAAAQRRAN